MRILSWNVNGIRSVFKKGFLKWFEDVRPDMLCIQETKAWPEQLPEELINPSGYASYFASAERKGYSGVALYSNKKPERVEYGLGDNRLDKEGRIIIAYFPDFSLYNVYFPNGKASKERLKFKLDFYDALVEHALREKGKARPVIICGDVNTAHTEIDLARPKENEKVSGFLPIERQWIDKLISKGFVDTFRVFNKEPGQYTWWDMKTRARERNVGWRIDYFFVSEDLIGRLKSAFIMPDVTGSDHCPIGIDLDIE
ncbi:MAG: exodeoxyribonuclease III [Deltaproteobacteria bacterium]|nr:MAG: exodeoxyribonuclease III [Deltaproteobacteria bacterium]